MSLILNIDTATENAHVSFAENGQVIQVRFNDTQKDHAAFLQTAIGELTQTTGIALQDLDAVAVTAGPGSYTGLRVGFASAKGLCYALQKPLISIGTLDVLTASALRVYKGIGEPMLFCPMIDARRMEVFTAIYQKDLALVLEPTPMILDAAAFEKELSQHKILFFGNGADKWEQVCTHPNAHFQAVSIAPEAMSGRVNTLFSENNFTELAYSEPLYLKEFQIVTQKPHNNT